MSKKIIFLMTFLALSISNNIKTMVFALTLSGSSSDNQEQFDGNCCCDCIRNSMFVVAALLKSSSSQTTHIQTTDIKDKRSNKLDLLASQWSISRSKEHME